MQEPRTALALDENRLFLASLFLAFAGIGALFFLSQSLSPAQVEVSQLSGEDVGKFVSAKGSVRSIYNGAGFTSFSLCTSNCIKAVVFNRNAGASVKQGNFVLVEGRVSEFKGVLQITVESVEVLK